MNVVEKLIFKKIVQGTVFLTTTDYVESGACLN